MLHKDRHPASLAGPLGEGNLSIGDDTAETTRPPRELANAAAAPTAAEDWRAASLSQFGQPVPDDAGGDRGAREDIARHGVLEPVVMLVVPSSTASTATGAPANWECHARRGNSTVPIRWPSTSSRTLARGGTWTKTDRPACLVIVKSPRGRGRAAGRFKVGKNLPTLPIRGRDAAAFFSGRRLWRLSNVSERQHPLGKESP